MHGFPKKLVLVPGKTPPDASGSRPDSRYGKSSDVGRPPFRSTRPQGEMRQPTGGLGRDLLMGDGPKSFDAVPYETGLYGTFPSYRGERFTLPICGGD